MHPNAHQPLALRYRPFRFEGEGAPVAQAHVTRALKAAVRKGRVAPAYLFCGPHGVGKTTLARVLAAALNCPRSDQGEPCGACETCMRIRSGSETLDVREMDAASNGGVQSARDLREQVMYAASEDGRYKVYILDEAHMLSREAWNALLKTLEEPPARVIFVFATTEVEKIRQMAPPVLSRCQRFDFHSVPAQEVIEHLRNVADREGIRASEDALVFIARKADGAMRDALSLLDQVVTYAEPGSEITAEIARRSFGLLAETVYVKAMGLIANEDVAGVTRLVRWLRDTGGRYEEFYRQFWRSVYDLLGVLSGTPPEGWSAQGAAALERASAQFEAREVMTYLARLGAEEEALRASREPDLVLATTMLLLIAERRRLRSSAG
jgi:DNA polymerase III subunit gamma/tau